MPRRTPPADLTARVPNAPPRSSGSPTAPPAAPGPLAPDLGDVFVAGVSPGPKEPTGVAVELGHWGDEQQPFRLEADGTVARGPSPRTVSERIRAAKLALFEAPNHQPFAAVTDAQALRAVAASAAQMHAVFRQAPRNEAHALELRAGRAAALGLVEAAARRANALGDVSTRDALAFGLLSLADTEPFRPLKDFTLDRLVGLGEKGELPKVGTAEAQLYPKKPPYEQWLRDGVVKITHYTDNDGSPRGGTVVFYQELGFKRTDHPDGSTTLRREAAGQRPAIEVTVPAAPAKDQPPALFEKINDPATDIIIYSGHAGYGRRVEDALTKGKAGTGDGKLVMLLQCSGDVSIEGVSRSFPSAQLISSVESTDNNYDRTLLGNLLKGIDQRASYEAIRDATNRDFTDWVTAQVGKRPQEAIDGYRTQRVETHYFYPDQRKAFIGALDRDRDGVRDDQDDLFNVVARKRSDAAAGFDPLDPGVSVDALDGTVLNAAVDQMLLIARYAEWPAGLLKNVPWHANAFESRGYHQAAPGDLRAFRFDVKPGSNAISVSMNAAFAHAPKAAMCQMLAIEAGRFVGMKAGLDPVHQAALSLAFLERVRHQATRSGENTDPSPIESDEAHDLFLKARYGLGVSTAQLQKATGNPDDFVAATYERLVSLVRSTPGLEDVGAVAPKRATSPVDVPANMIVGGHFSVPEMTDLVKRFGLGLTFDATHLRYGKFIAYGKTAAVPVRDEKGQPAYLTLGIDSEGLVRAASLVRLDTQYEGQLTSGF